MPAPIRRHTSAHVVNQLLEQPELPEVLRTLPAENLLALVTRVGLEDSGELVGLLSPTQLAELFDADLWRSAQPGEDETFDSKRFATWLEVLLEGGSAFVADRLEEQSEELLVFAFSRLVFALDLPWLEGELTGRVGELVEKSLDACPSLELGDYLLVAREWSGWDAVVDTLLALDERHPDLLQRILHAIWAAGQEELDEADDLRSVLSTLEMLQSDAEAARGDRRSARGYVSPADARAFLGLAARTPPLEPEQDPVSRAYFRHLDPQQRPAPQRPAPKAETSTRLPQLLARLLDDAGQRTTARVDPPPSDAVVDLRVLLRELESSEPSLHRRAVEELAFLTNVFLAGGNSSLRGSPEALAEAVHVCEEGLRALRAHTRLGSAELLRRFGPVLLFRWGWPRWPRAPRAPGQ